MNYFEHHIGDYAVATSHLSFVEDAALSRMIRKYYALEKPLPADLKQVQRLVGARTKEEKLSVETVLAEFFILEADGWHNAECDAAIEKYLDGEPEREVKKANENNRVKKHREERASLFKRLTDAGHHASWNINIAELRELVKRVTGDSVTPETETVTQPVTAPVTPATATQAPIPTTQYPLPNTQELTTNPESLSLASTVGAAEETPEAERLIPERNVQISILLRAAGIKPFTFMHPLAIDWASNPAVTDAILQGAVDMAKQAKGDNATISPNYLKPIVEQLLTAPTEAKPHKPAQDAWWTSNAGIERKGRELGMYARGTENYNDFKDRIFAKLREEGKAA